MKKFGRKKNFSFLWISVLVIPFLSMCSTPEQSEDLEITEFEILTPKPPKEPKINGAKVFGVHPGNPVIFTVPATGERPMKFSARNLPEGVSLNEENGRLSGIIHKAGSYDVHITAENAHGVAERDLTIVAGDQLALTPPMGWTSWNGWGDHVTAEQVKTTAKAMVETGLINHGWTYINIDVGWEGKRGGKYNAIMPNERFPDMQELCDYIHSLGLK
ncbi:MAG: putative Ig domain-containing protein, partial [Bacteroidales bacterium]|nr:putative Ig domain-containing protein [Bacteroidales bacterium]